MEAVIKPITHVIFDIPVFSISRLELISLLNKNIVNCKKTKLAFANANTLNIAYSDDTYSDVLKSFLVVNDGIGVDIAAKILFNKTFIENLNGTDFMPALFSYFPENTKVYFLGSTEKNIRKAVERFKLDFPHLNLVGAHNGYFGTSNNIVQTINSSGAEVVVVGLGNPMQEFWIDDYSHKIDASLFIGVGAFFDFYSGEIPRAPDIIRKLRFEWLYRLLLEPKRLWKRYVIGNIQFLFRVLKEKYR